MNCVIGCQCPPGHWEDVDGSCVEDDSLCTPSGKVENECESNKIWQECGTACPKKCGEEEPFICTMNCVIGCQCPPGHWEDVDGSCVEDDSMCMPMPLDMDPCEQQGLLCHPDAQCVEMFVGGWQCMCKDGFVGDGQQDCEEPPMKMNGK